MMNLNALLFSISSRIFQRNISANRFALVGMAGGNTRGKVLVKVLFSDNNSESQMFLNGIDWYLEHY